MSTAAIILLVVFAVCGGDKLGFYMAFAVLEEEQK